MAITDGQRVRALESNAAWASKTANNTLSGVQTFSNGGSGPSIANVQQKINDIDSDLVTAQNDITNLQADVAVLESLDTFIYAGVWSAATNSPTLADGDGGATYGPGATFRVNAAGTQNLGSGAITFQVGDKVVYNTVGVWEKWDVIDSDIQLDELQDVDTTGVAQRNLLARFATDWQDMDPNEVATDAVLTGANQTVAAVDAFFKLIRLTNAGLVSVEGIGFTYGQQKLFLSNETGVSIDILNDTGATAANRIITGTGATITLLNNQTILLVYDSVLSRWKVISKEAIASATVAGLVSTSAQTWAGQKTFNSAPILNSLTASKPLKLNGSKETISAAIDLANNTDEVTGVLKEVNGGTNQSSYATGDLLYSSAPNVLSKLPIGTVGQILTILGGVPTWQNPAASGGGGGALKWITASGNAPINVQENGLDVWLFQSGLGQEIFAGVRVPNTYDPGNPVVMRLPSYSPDASGTNLLQSVATLIRTGVDAITSTTNQRTSTNAAISLSVANRLISHSLDLSDGTGSINGVPISAGDLILVKVTRGTDSALSDVAAVTDAAEVTFT